MFLCVVYLYPNSLFKICLYLQTTQVGWFFSLPVLAVSTPGVS